MRAATELRIPLKAVTLSAVAICLSAAAQSPQTPQSPKAPCKNPVYLTFDTGHMGVAPLIAEVLQRQQMAHWVSIGHPGGKREPLRAMLLLRTLGTMPIGGLT